jgi:hypothetical protein
MLKELKKETKAKSVDAVIQELLSRPIGGAAQDGGSGSEPEARPEAANKRKKNVRDALYSSRFCWTVPKCWSSTLGLTRDKLRG